MFSKIDPDFAPRTKTERIRQNRTNTLNKIVNEAYEKKGNVNWVEKNMGRFRATTSPQELIRQLKRYSAQRKPWMMINLIEVLFLFDYTLRTEDWEHIIFICANHLASDTKFVGFGLY